jgi:hypothetical protein
MFYWFQQLISHVLFKLGLTQSRVRRKRISMFED